MGVRQFHHSFPAATGSWRAFLLGRRLVLFGRGRRGHLVALRPNREAVGPPLVGPPALGLPGWTYILVVDFLQLRPEHGGKVCHTSVIEKVFSLKIQGY